MNPGVLPSQSLRTMISEGVISGDEAVLSDQIQPASLDLRLGSVAWRLRASFLPGRGRSVTERLDVFRMHQIDLTEGAVLERGCVYLVPLVECVNLPAGIGGTANAKSSTGRLDILTRVVTDGGVEFDRIPEGYRGMLYAEICPRSFSVLARTGQRLNQMRLRKGDPALSDPELVALHRSHGLVSGIDEATISGGLGFSVDLEPRKGGIVGYRARPHCGIVDLDGIAGHRIEDYWDEVKARDGRLILDPGAFYILVSREAVHIPPGFAAEMAPYLAMVGEFRVHYAGFFDPGFGHAAAGGSGARGVLEVRCHEAPFAMEHGQSVGRLIYERMLETPDILYGSDLKSNYQGQGLKLSKHFRPVSSR